TSNYGADMGKHAGATIEVATKGGTKDFHGDAFEYVRNDKFDANPWFVNRGGGPNGGSAPKTPRKWNDYGYTFGGPLLHSRPLQHGQVKDLLLLVSGLEIGRASCRERVLISGLDVDFEW